MAGGGKMDPAFIKQFINIGDCRREDIAASLDSLELEAMKM
jgi:hypothetical protein